jgi:hypothetical protein
MTKKIFTLVLLIIFLLPGLVIAQQPVTITVNAGAEKTKISPFIFGKNNSLSDNPGNPISASEWQKLKDLGITVFRENGGNNSTKYNWRRKLSSHPDWYNNVYTHNWGYAAQMLQENIPSVQGMWSFQLIGYAAKTNAHNFNDWGYNRSQWWNGVHQNLAGGGTVDSDGGSEALEDGNPELYLEEWPPDSTVKILDHWFGETGIGLDSTKIRYWGMDNEPEIWNGTHDDVMPEMISAEEFMQIYFEVAKKARSKFPGIKLCGPVPANEWQWYNWKNDAISYKGKKYPWLEYFILRVAEEQEATGIRLLDVLDIHFYPGETNPADILQLHRVYFDKTYVYPGANGVKRINGGWDNSQNKEYIFARCEAWLEKYIGSDHGVTFGVSETGINTNNPNIAASWYASTLGEFAKNGIDFFTPWSWKTGMYEVIHLFSNYSQSFFVEGISSDEVCVSAYPTMSENADSMTIFLINRHQSEPKTVQMDIQNFVIGKGSVQMLSLSDLPDNETFVSHSQNALKNGETYITNYFLTAELAPLSVNAVFLKAAPDKNQAILKSQNQIKIFPNPTTDKATLEVFLNKNSKVKVDLINMNGQKISQLLEGYFYSGWNSAELNLTNCPPGMYWISIQTDHFRQNVKISIQSN